MGPCVGRGPAGEAVVGRHGMRREATLLERELLAALFSDDYEASEWAREWLSRLPMVSDETTAALGDGLQAGAPEQALSCARVLDRLGLDVEAANACVIA